ncbi:hypothetical protein [Syntrophothermus lipocalidus]|uniref:hypothetical protein n=1 Tax=Syntrophothermus lipocalidus TaxID=86170 RepID=UPI00031908FA|nr:hypothetical protein [Syntrophothermus lipocalidus]
MNLIQVRRERLKARYADTRAERTGRYGLNGVWNGSFSGEIFFSRARTAREVMKKALSIPMLAISAIVAMGRKPPTRETKSPTPMVMR